MRGQDEKNKTRRAEEELGPVWIFGRRLLIGSAALIRVLAGLFA
jgi:hypothetical protein